MTYPATQAEEEQPAGAFDLLDPRIVPAAVEGVVGVSLDGTVEPYASYVNRVYGVRSDEGERLVVKFYRPGRWGLDAIREEHRFLRQLAEAEVPVVEPWTDEDGDSLFEVELAADGDDGTAEHGVSDGDGVESPTIPFAVFPRRGGRTFDAERDEDWYRLGAVVGRMHAVGRREDSAERRTLSPDLARAYVTGLLDSGVVHPDMEAEFGDLCGATLERVAPRFQGVNLQRIHGDCHRGNILDRPGDGLMLIDFDDMVMGPAVQDLWLLLPDRLEHARRELTMLLDGYDEFSSLDRRETELIEPLRFMRMIHFLAWRAAQRHDHWFRRQEPEWGNRAFWIRELEDLRDQAHILA